MLYVTPWRIIIYLLTQYHRGLTSDLDHCPTLHILTGDKPTKHIGHERRLLIRYEQSI
jgi:hypothetical protein